MRFARAAVLAAGLLGGGVVAAQPAPRSAVRSSVSGVVFDSLAGRPLAGAIVQLVNADSVSAAPLTSTSDSAGRYVLTDVHAGHWLLGFVHPMVDSLGVEAPSQPLSLDGRSPARNDLFIPSAVTLRTALCGAAAVADSDALIIGFARHARTRFAVDSATVTAQWVELLLGMGTVNRRLAKRTVGTPESGWFAICGAPAGGMILLSAVHGADTSASLELEIPRSGFLRRDLYFGDARLASARTDSATDSLTPGVQITGDGRVSGTVVAAKNGAPLAGAGVSITNGPWTRTNDQGAFTLTGVPSGTRMLQVRAVAHYPIAVAVDVVEGAAPVRVAMSTLDAVLDTVRITAKRTGSGNLIAFLQRKRSSGAGKFITSEEIARRNPLETSDLFRTVAGLTVLRDRYGQDVITMRGGLTFSGGGRCQPTVYMNGMALRDLSARDINAFIRPNELVGVEIYHGQTAPAQFSDFNGCGSIVFWTR